MVIRNGQKQIIFTNGGDELLYMILESDIGYWASKGVNCVGYR